MAQEEKLIPVDVQQPDERELVDHDADAGCCGRGRQNAVDRHGRHRNLLAGSVSAGRLSVSAAGLVMRAC